MTSAFSPIEEITMRKRSQKAERYNEQIKTALKDFHKKKFRSIRVVAKALNIFKPTL